jgi:hypothetical protein
MWQPYLFGICRWKRARILKPSHGHGKSHNNIEYDKEILTPKIVLCERGKKRTEQCEEATCQNFPQYGWPGR